MVFDASNVSIIQNFRFYSSFHQADPDFQFSGSLTWLLSFWTVKTTSYFPYQLHIHHSIPCTTRHHPIINDLTNQFISEWECLPQIFALSAFEASICSEPLASMLVNKIFRTYVDLVKGKFSERKCNHLTLFTFLFLFLCAWMFTVNTFYQFNDHFQMANYVRNLHSLMFLMRE
jgi:hypothetical protein